MSKRVTIIRSTDLRDIESKKYTFYSCYYMVVESRDNISVPNYIHTYPTPYIW